MHDVHAWRFVVAPGLIEVRADPARFRPADDPAARSLHLSCGAALVNLRLAAAQLGHEAVVRHLPSPERRTLLAAVRLAGRHRVTRSERLLYAAALRPRQTSSEQNASPPLEGGTRLPLPVLNELVEEARLEGASLRPVPGVGRQHAVLTTAGDSLTDWLRAGQALQRVLLAGTARSVSVSVSVSFRRGPSDLPGVRDIVQPGEVPQVTLTLAPLSPAPVRPPALIEPAEDREDEGQRHWERVR